MDVAYSAAMEALAAGADMADWFVALIAAVAASDDVRDGEVPFLRRPGSWESAGVGNLAESAGAYDDPDAHRRVERQLLHDQSLRDVVEWIVPGLRELYGDALANRANALAAEIDTEWRAKVNEL